MASVDKASIYRCLQVYFKLGTRQGVSGTVAPSLKYTRCLPATLHRWAFHVTLEFAVFAFKFICTTWVLSPCAAAQPSFTSLLTDERCFYDDR